jgi:hypothetical protein
LTSQEAKSPLSGFRQPAEAKISYNDMAMSEVNMAYAKWLDIHIPVGGFQMSNIRGETIGGWKMVQRRSWGGEAVSFVDSTGPHILLVNLRDLVWG